MPCWDNLQLCFGVCRIGIYSVFHCLCCRKSTPPKAEYSVVCIGLTNSGKTTLLSALCNETVEDVQPTTGFIIKPCVFTDCILNTKEIGGGERQRPFWRHYYHDVQAVIFVIDSACSDEEMADTKAALHEALAHPDLEDLPCVLLANCQDKINARNPEKMKECLDFGLLSQKHSRIEMFSCSALKDIASVRQYFETFIDHHFSSNRTYSQSK